MVNRPTRGPGLLLAAAVLCGGAAGLLVLHPEWTAPRVAVADEGASISARVAEPAPTTVPTQTPTASAASPAASVTEALAADAAPPASLSLPGTPAAGVEPVGVLADGQLQIPANPAVVGWWAGGSAPGDPAGLVVMVGHIDSAAYGLGLFSRLPELVPGQRITVTSTAGQVVSYTITGLQELPKSQLPRALFEPRSAPGLVLITCGGTFSRATHYADNILVYAAASHA